MLLLRGSARPMTDTQTETPEYLVREYEPGDEEAILASFNRVFAEVEPGFVPRTLPEWRWRYRENPSGLRIFLALTPEGEVISQFAGIPQRALLEGRPAHFSQGVDSFTHPRFRRGLKRPGYFVLTAWPYVEHYSGPPPGGDTMMWGLPVWQAWRIGKRFLQEELVRTQLKLVLRPGRFRPAPAPGVEVEEVARFPAELDPWFPRAAAPHAAIAVRDSAQLDWRFTRHPTRRYAVGLARRGRELLGYAVYRRGSFDGEESGLVCDWLTLPGQPAAAAALRQWLQDRARAEGEERLTALFPDTAPEWLDFQRAGYTVRPTRYFMVARSFVEHYSVRWFHRSWYYTLGETDLC